MEPNIIGVSAIHKAITGILGVNNLGTVHEVDVFITILFCQPDSFLNNLATLYCIFQSTGPIVLPHRQAGQADDGNIRMCLSDDLIEGIVRILQPLRGGRIVVVVINECAERETCLLRYRKSQD